MAFFAPFNILSLSTDGNFRTYERKFAFVHDVEVT
jgi:hypothetical protein